MEIIDQLRQENDQLRAGLRQANELIDQTAESNRRFASLLEQSSLALVDALATINRLSQFVALVDSGKAELAMYDRKPM